MADTCRSSKSGAIPQILGATPGAKGTECSPSQRSSPHCLAHLFSTSSVVVTVAVTVVGAVAGLIRHTSPNTPNRSATSTCKDVALHEHGRWCSQSLW